MSREAKALTYVLMIVAGLGAICLSVLINVHTDMAADRVIQQCTGVSK